LSLERIERLHFCIQGFLLICKETLFYLVCILDGVVLSYVQSKKLFFLSYLRCDFLKQLPLRQNILGLQVNFRDERRLPIRLTRCFLTDFLYFFELLGKFTLLKQFHVFGAHFFEYIGERFVGKDLLNIKLEKNLSLVIF